MEEHKLQEVLSEVKFKIKFFRRRLLETPSLLIKLIFETIKIINDCYDEGKGVVSCHNTEVFRIV